MVISTYNNIHVMKKRIIWKYLYGFQASIRTIKLVNIIMKYIKQIKISKNIRVHKIPSKELAGIINTS